MKRLLGITTDPCARVFAKYFTNRYGISQKSIVWIAWGFAVIAVCLISFDVVAPSVSPERLEFFFLVMVAVTTVILNLLSRRAESAFQQELEAGDFLPCEICGYNLNALEDRNVCPECGIAFDNVELQNTWRAWVAKHRK